VEFGAEDSELMDPGCMPVQNKQFHELETSYGRVWYHSRSARLLRGGSSCEGPYVVFRDALKANAAKVLACGGAGLLGSEP
jgi:hypothetical protein